MQFLIEGEDSGIKALCRDALSLKGEKSIIKILKTLEESKNALLEIYARIKEPKSTKEVWLANHPIMQYLAHLLRNRTCQSSEQTMRRCEVIIEDMARL